MWAAKYLCIIPSTHAHVQTHIHLHKKYIYLHTVHAFIYIYYTAHTCTLLHHPLFGHVKTFLTGILLSHVMCRSRLVCLQQRENSLSRTVYNSRIAPPQLELLYSLCPTQTSNEQVAMTHTCEHNLLHIH